ncbi:MAG: sodium:calcium antiporter [Candidatus Limnocylindrales bacterium]
MELLELGIALVVILAAAELFTNGIEWFGHKLNLAEGAVGSVLAAVGTALPVTMIPLVAILFAGTGTEASAAGHDIGVGAILGAPFMLATLAMFVTGVGVLVYARRRRTGRTMPIDTHVLGLDIRYFFLAYSIAVGAAFVPAELSWLRYVAVVALIGVYAWYVKSHFESDTSIDAVDLAPLRFRRIDRRRYSTDPEGHPRLRIVNIQVVVALLMIIGGAFVFVDAVEHIAESLRLDAVLLALIIAPIATELPEKFNSLIWVRQGKDTLAMGNITGAMVFQSCIPTAIGVVLAAEAWTISSGSLLSFASAGIAFISTAAIFLPMVRRGSLSGGHLLIGGLFYVLYVALVVARLAGIF